MRDERNKLLYLSALARRAQRLRDCAAYARDAVLVPGQLDWNHRTAFVSAHRAYLGELREDWRALHAAATARRQEQQETPGEEPKAEALAPRRSDDEEDERDEDERRQAAAAAAKAAALAAEERRQAREREERRQRRLRVAEQAVLMKHGLRISDFCADFVATVDRVLETEQIAVIHVSLLSARADFLRYAAEPRVGECRDEAIRLALAASTQAHAEAQEKLRPTDTTRIAIVVNLGVLYEELLGSPSIALRLAQGALTEANKSMNKLPDVFYAQATKNVQLLRDRVESWTVAAGQESDEEEEEEEERELTIEELMAQFTADL